MTAFLLSALLWSLQPISLSVDKRIGFPPLTVTAEIRIPRHAENRAACVSLVGPVEDQSCWDLSLESSPVFRRTWSRLWEGRYFAQARLLRGRATYFSTTAAIVVAENP